MNKGGRPPLQQGQIRAKVTLSLTKQQLEKLRRISGNEPSKWLRVLIDQSAEK